MKITGFGTVSSTNNVNKKRGVGASGLFSDLLSASESADNAPASATGDVVATSGLNNLLALQEISEDDVHKRKLVKHGHSMLDSLEQLRRQILMGTVPGQTLLDISRQLSLQKQTVLDPRLIDIIEDIELRTAVELAKLEMAAARMADPSADEF